ncbi:DUF418 domain-containing protein [Brevundimonas balnearis]|uniref:DUF418 domain-containing protein n=1 Tax=Brevundimonas balnearis TaxID=1572858 RepID=A0ABV6R655_9CAUL
MSAAEDVTLAPAAAARPAPIRREDRIIHLDILRGFAVLGILAVNAATFAWPPALDFDPTLARPWVENAANVTGEWVVDVFFQDKFRSLFSMLFGVSIFLIGGERHDEAKAPVLHRRLMWLGLFGLIHGAAIWMGDILLHYAYCGLIAMLGRSWSARRLILIGGGLNLVFALISALGLWAQAAFAGQGDSGQNPFAATPEDIQALIAAYQSGFPAAQIENFKSWLLLETLSLFLAPITIALMWLGLGLFKAGFLVGRAPAWVYLILVALAAGNLAFFAPNAWLDANAEAGTYPSGGMAGIGASFAWVITLGYASALILMTKFGLGIVSRRFAPVGQMAFTNYLSQSLIMASLFYLPWGPMWFGDERFAPGGMWWVVGAVWLLQLVWSPLWLSRFEMGPLEWLWRGLTYGRLPPLRRRRA